MGRAGYVSQRESIGQELLATHRLLGPQGTRLLLWELGCTATEIANCMADLEMGRPARLPLLARVRRMNVGAHLVHAVQRARRHRRPPEDVPIAGAAERMIAAAARSAVGELPPWVKAEPGIRRSRGDELHGEAPPPWVNVELGVSIAAGASEADDRIRRAVELGDIDEVRRLLSAHPYNLPAEVTEQLGAAMERHAGASAERDYRSE